MGDSGRRGGRPRPSRGGVPSATCRDASSATGARRSTTAGRRPARCPRAPTRWRPRQRGGAAAGHHVTLEQARSILTRNASPDIPFDVSLNPYRGCEHGCIYCFARPTHAYLDLSPGLDFESRLFAKANAAERLRHALSRPFYRCETIALGVNTDAYQPIEREHRITRSVLEVLHACDHPVALITKSALIERDIDLLAPMAAKRRRGRRHHHHVGCRTGAHPGAACGGAIAPAAHDPHAQRGRHSGGCQCGALIPFVTEPDTGASSRRRAKPARSMPTTSCCGCRGR